MASLLIVLALLTHFISGLTFILDNANHTLNWPTEYHFRGESINILSGLVEPFEIWYSAKLNRSRKDFYGGTVKEYFVGKNGSQFVQHIKILPVTTEEESNEIVCVRKDSTESHSGFLPSNENYKIEGHKNYNEKSVEVWKFVEIEYKKKLGKTLYVYQNDVGNSIPVYLEITKHNLWTAALTAHTIIHYYGYGEPDAAQLNPDSEKACEETDEDESDQGWKLPKNTSSEIESIFKSYIIEHKKKYDGDEHEMRKKIFQENFRRVVEHNKKNTSYKMTLNKFSDHTEDELANLLGAMPPLNHVGSVPFPHTEEEIDLLAQELPESYDMRAEGFIGTVKNQGKCGSCWAFSTVAAVEGALARSNGGRNIELSEQSLMDCAWGFGNMGCSGGFLDRALNYVLTYGLPSHMDYGSYLAKEGICKIKTMNVTYKARSFAAVPFSINAMKLALYKYGPVSVTINANRAFFAYDSGIFYDPTCNYQPLNHAVTVVGYGVNKRAAPYWIVKNSWGEDWGEDGYILFSTFNNNCHILENAFYPIFEYK